MNLQTEVTQVEVAGILRAMESSGRFVRSYSQLVRAGLEMLKAAYGFEEMTLEVSRQYLSMYGGAGLRQADGLSIKQLRSIDLAQERKEGKMEAAGVALPSAEMPAGSMLAQMLRNRAFFDAEAEKILKKLPVPEAEEVDSELEQMRAEAAEEGGEE
jgi:hypothetical protein